LDINFITALFQTFEQFKVCDDNFVCWTGKKLLRELRASGGKRRREGGKVGINNFGGFLYSASVGFRIWKEHINVSSTLIMAPALSNSPQ